MPAHLFGQNVDNDFFKRHLERKTYSIDTSADAVILYEKGKTEIIPTATGLEQHFTVHRIARIIKRTPADNKLFSICIPYYTHKRRVAGIHNVQGRTYNLINGKMIIAALNKDSIITSNIDDGYKVTKFNLPDVTDGSIIDYSFELWSDFSYTPPDWQFQDEYPKLCSEYELSAPGKLKYKVLFQGDYSFKEFKSEEQAKENDVAKYMVVLQPDVNDVYNVIWGERNILPLRKEPYSGSLINYSDLLELQISATGGKNIQGHVLTSWPEMDDKLWHEPRFGGFLTKNNREYNYWTDSVITGKGDEISKAVALFSFVRNNFHAESDNSVLVSENADHIEPHTKTTTADVNMLLIYMLRQAGLDAAPAILSTKGHLRGMESYPAIRRFNYIVCALNIADSTYWLDASDKYNSFGILPQQCYNGYIRVVNNGSGTGITLTSDDAMEKNVYYVGMQFTDNGDMEMQVAEKPGVFLSHDLRSALDDDSSKAMAYVKKEAESFNPGAVVTSMDITNLDDPDTGLQITYKLTIKGGLSDLTYLNTDYIHFFNSNPFFSAKRTLPIEFDSKINDQYILNVRLPQNYKVTDMPQPVAISYAGGEMSYRHLLSYDSTLNLLSVNARLITDRAMFPKTEYDNLRTFFEKLIEAQAQMVVVKKEL